MIGRLLDGNRRFVDNEFQPNRDYYDRLAKAQHPEILWIGCSDSRVSEDLITDSKPGTMFVHRNVANIVSFNDVNFAAILEFALHHLHIEHVVVCGHYGCGGIRALEAGNVQGHYISDWLVIAGGAKEKVDRLAAERGLAPQQKLDLLCEENVRLQIKHLQNISLVRNLRQQGPVPYVHGMMYSLDSGTLDLLVDGGGADRVVRQSPAGGIP